MIQVLIESVGTLHPDALELLTIGGLVFDVGGSAFRNPHDDPAMRYRTGLDAAVREHVLTTPGIMPMVERIAVSARGVLDAWADARHRLVRVTVACRGGRHRSVAVAEAVGAYMRGDGVEVEVSHRHIHLPVVEDRRD